MIAIVGSALAMGAVDTPVLLALAVVTCASAFLSWWDADSLEPRRVASIVLWVALGLAVLTSLQCVPLPRGVVGALSPHAADVWSRALRPLGEEGPSWITLSLDPTATRIEAMRGVVYLATFLAALRVAWHREGAVLLERSLVAAGTLVTLAAAVHYAFGIDRVYGFYRPRTDVTSIAPLLNMNHLAAFANVALILCLASMLSRSPMLPRPILASMILLLGAAEFWYASRGGVGAMLAAATLVGLLRARNKVTRLVNVALPLTLAFAGVAMLVLAATPAALQGLTDTDTSKLGITRDVLTRMMPAYPFFGAGRGAFEQAFPEFRTGGGYVVWSHPENLVGQWISEWGVIASVVGFAALAYALRPRTIAARSNAPIGAWAVIVAIVLHNLVDYSLEIPAIALALAVCAALATAGSARSEKLALVDRWASRPKLVAVGAALGLVGAGVAFFARGGELLDDRAALHQLRVDDAPDDVFRPRLRRAMLDHPAEPYFSYIGAEWQLSKGDAGNVMPWVERTLERAPIYAPAHLVLARWLRRRSPSQARLEYRIYAEQGGTSPPVKEVAPLVGSYEAALEVVPSGTAGVPLLDALSLSMSDRMPATQARIDAEIVARDPKAKPALLRLAGRAIADVGRESWCEAAPKSCVDEAKGLVASIEAIAPNECAGFALEAQLTAATGDKRGAIDSLRKAADSVTDRAECQRKLAELAIASDMPEEASSAIEALSRSPCGAGVSCTDNLLAAAALEEQRGNRLRALAFLRRAHLAAPDDEAVAERAAGAASAAGLHSEASSIYADLAQRHPATARYRALADDERGKIVAGP